MESELWKTRLLIYLRDAARERMFDLDSRTGPEIKLIGSEFLREDGRDRLLIEMKDGEVYEVLVNKI